MEKIRLEECCEILDSKRIPITAKDRKSGIYPYYGANGIQDYVDGYIFDDELVLLAEDGGNFGSKERPIAYRVSGKCWVNNHAHVLKAKEMLDIDYLCYSLMFYDVGGMVNGATRQKLTQSQMRQMLIPKRSLKEQKEIVKKLASLDEIKEKRREQLSLLDNLIKSRFVEMFGDPVSNTKCWNTEHLCDIGVLGRGVSKHRPRNAPELLGGKYPLIQTGDVANADLYITEYKTTYSEIGLNQSKMWEKGTLCITIAANIAKTSILSFDACFPDSVVGFVAKTKTNNIFMHYWFGFFQQLLESQAPESAQKNINLQILCNLEVIVPPLNLQTQFATFVQQVDKLKVELQQSLNELQMLFDSLMQKYFD